MQIKGHPIIYQMSKLRVILEKLRPLNKKLQFSINQVLKTAFLGNIQEEGNSGINLR